MCMERSVQTRQQKNISHRAGVEASSGVMVKCKIERIELPDFEAGSASGLYYETKKLLTTMVEYISVKDDNQRAPLGIKVRKGRKRKMVEICDFPESARLSPQKAIELLASIDVKIENWGSHAYFIRNFPPIFGENEGVRIVISKGLGPTSSLHNETSIVEDVTTGLTYEVNHQEYIENVPEKPEFFWVNDLINNYVRERLVRGKPDEVHQKYWDQRYRIFIRFDRGILLDAESWYSVTYECIGEEIASTCLRLSRSKGSPLATVWDGFSGCGGTGISFCRRGFYVTAIDIDSTKLRYFRHNAGIYNASNQVECLQQDIWQAMRAFVRPSQFNSILLKMIKKKLITQEVMDQFPFLPFSWPRNSDQETNITNDTIRKKNKVIDLFVLCPPWGGPEYLDTETWNFRTMMPCGDGYLLAAMAYSAAKNIALVLPRNTSTTQLETLSQLLGTRCYVQEMNIKRKCKLIVAYFGNLFQ